MGRSGFFQHSEGENLLGLAILGVALTASHAQQGTPDDFPLGVMPPITRYQEQWRNSPFQLEAPPEVVTAKAPSYAGNYALGGVIKEGKIQVAYLIERKTKRFLRVTADEGDDGFQLLEVEGDEGGSRGTFVTVVRDGIPARIGYDDSYLNQPSDLAAAPAAEKSPARSEEPAGTSLSEKLRLRLSSSGNSEGAKEADQPAASGASSGNSSTSGSETTRRRVVLPNGS